MGNPCGLDGLPVTTCHVTFRFGLCRRGNVETRFNASRYVP
jgi:hypothetical protein